jgi:hypothetical protein
MTTDREYLKQAQSGHIASTGAAAPITEVGYAHTRARDFMKTGSENAATNVAESAMFVVNRKSKLVAADLHVPSNVATSNTDYLTLKVYKRDSAGANQLLVASYNTHGGAQGAVTQWIAKDFSINTTSDTHVIAAGSVLTYEIVKGSATGVALPTLSIFSFDLEEV